MSSLKKGLDFELLGGGGGGCKTDQTTTVVCLNCTTVFREESCTREKYVVVFFLSTSHPTVILYMGFNVDVPGVGLATLFLFVFLGLFYC